MAKLLGLPNELLTPITGHLRDGKIDRFDSVATKDLQTMRLVCPTLSEIATPMLFENMVLDFKFWERRDMDKMVRFAAANPKLAKLVRRLQLRVPDIISVPLYTIDSSCIFRLALHDNWFTQEDENAEIEETTNEPTQQQRADLISKTHLGKAVRRSTWTMGETFELLPNLSHAENAMSTHYRNVMGSECVDAQVAQHFYKWSKYDQIGAFMSGFRGIVAHMGGAITSLKLREITARFDNYTLEGFPSNLQHLDLDLRILWVFSENRFSEGEHRIIGIWRSVIRGLRQLKSLRLAFACGGDRTGGNAGADAEEHSTTSPDPLYIDDLLIDPQNDADQCSFPQLRSLRLVNCSLRVRGLQNIATRHGATLKELELRKVTFDSGYSVKSWSEIGAMCHEVLPNLAYLRLAKLITHSIILGAAEGPKNLPSAAPKNLPVPVKWNMGLEGATSYEWIKNGRGAGADLEIIGHKCPWTFEGVND